MKSNLRFFLVVMFGAMIGSVLNELLDLAHAPLWLVNKLTLGLQPPFELDLLVCKLTLGLTVTMSLASVIGMVIALVVFHKRL